MSIAPIANVGQQSLIRICAAVVTLMLAMMQTLTLALTDIGKQYLANGTLYRNLHRHESSLASLPVTY